MSTPRTQADSLMCAEYKAVIVCQKGWLSKHSYSDWCQSQFFSILNIYPLLAPVCVAGQICAPDAAICNWSEDIMHFASRRRLCARVRAFTPLSRPYCHTQLIRRSLISLAGTWQSKRGCWCVSVGGLISYLSPPQHLSQPKFCNSNQDSCTGAISAGARDVLFTAIKGLVFLLFYVRRH